MKEQDPRYSLRRLFWFGCHLWLLLYLCPVLDLRLLLYLCPVLYLWFLLYRLARLGLWLRKYVGEVIRSDNPTQADTDDENPDQRHRTLPELPGKWIENTRPINFLRLHDRQSCDACCSPRITIKQLVYCRW